MHRVAQAFWTLAPGVGEIRAEQLPEPGPDEVLVRGTACGAGGMDSSVAASPGCVVPLY